MCYHVGDYHQFKHPTKKGRVTITHPRKDIPLGTFKSILAQAGIVLP
nr:type II toxin-antitoxin system HicA family toxin [Mitsuokella sp. AF33-22]